MSDFTTRLDVLGYLEKEGWKVSKSKLYADCNKGRLLPGKGGEYEIKEVDAYAKDFLKRKDTGKKVDEELEDRNRKKLDAEIRKTIAQAAKAEHDLAVAQGKYIPREDVELELACRAAALDNLLKHHLQARAPELVRLVGGDKKKTPDLIEVLSNDIDQALNEFARTDNFQVILEANEAS